MLKQYRELLETIDETSKKKDIVIADLKKQELELSNLEAFINKRTKKYEEDLKKETEHMLELQLERVTSKYDMFRLDLTSFKNNVQEQVNEKNAAINSNKVYESNITDNSFADLAEKCDKVRSIFETYVSPETIELYTNLAYSINFKSKELEDIEEWLQYFENYECYDELMGKVEVVEGKINDQNDKWFTVICLLGVCAIIWAYAKITLPIYFAFILATLYLRCKEYFLLIKLLSVFNMINTMKTAVEQKCQLEIAEILTFEKEKVIEDQQDYKIMFDEIEANILLAEEAEKDKVKKNFDYESAKKLAAKDLKRDDDELKSRVELTKTNIESIKNNLKDLNDLLMQQQQDLEDLKVRIIKSYEQLEPSFQETDLIKEFFLGFEKATKQPVTFNYGGEPTVIFFQGMNDDSYKAVITTLIMMSSQIMCIMSPTSYTINVIDTRTAGSQLSAFQITSTKETTEESNIFKVISTSKEAKKHINALYEVFKERRVKLLGHYENIEDYNEKKTKTGARPESFIINFFFNYDYKILNETEEIKTICRVAKSIGIALFFMIDTEKIGEEKDLKYEELKEFLDLFTDKNLFGFNISDNSVSIINVNKAWVDKNFRVEKKGAKK